MEPSSDMSSSSGTVLERALKERIEELEKQVEDQEFVLQATDKFRGDIERLLHIRARGNMPSQGVVEEITLLLSGDVQW